MNITVAPNAPPINPPKNTPIVKVIMEVNSTFPILGVSWIATHREARMIKIASWRVVKNIVFGGIIQPYKHLGERFRRWHTVYAEKKLKAE